MKDQNILTPLSILQARELSENYQHLAGKKHSDLIIKEVVVGPYDDINKWVFLFHYRDYKNVEKAIRYYQGPFYDVLLLTENDQLEINYKDLRTYLTEAGQPLFVEEVE